MDIKPVSAWKAEMLYHHNLCSFFLISVHPANATPIDLDPIQLIFPFQLIYLANTWLVFQMKGKTVDEVKSEPSCFVCMLLVVWRV